MADVIANGDPPNIRARITWAYPAPLDPAATAVAVMLYKQATDGVFTGDDIAKLRAPLSSPLMSLSGLVSHQEKYLLASQRLTRSCQG
jgi:hypothetical protein